MCLLFHSILSVPLIWSHEKHELHKKIRKRDMHITGMVVQRMGIVMVKRERKWVKERDASPMTLTIRSRRTE